MHIAPRLNSSPTCANFLLTSMTQTIDSLYERIGATEGIATLLRYFYADVRQHALIGPVFLQQIEDWPSHLVKIGQFWARLTGGPSNFSGQVVGKHIALGIKPIHFTAWLELWDFNCRAHLPTREAQEMSQLAHDLGARLSGMIGR